MDRTIAFSKKGEKGNFSILPFTDGEYPRIAYSTPAMAKIQSKVGAIAQKE
jgi:hypothetical protein